MAAVAIGVGIAWTVGLLWFASTLPAGVNDRATPTDAIVVLTGGSERVETGIALLTEGLARQLFVSGVGGQARVEDLIKESALAGPELKTHITVGNAASNTPGNAAETAAWARAENVQSIRLVTAAYHMRRSLLELRDAMPGVQIIPHPVFPANVKADWWRWPGTAGLYAREYTKYLATWIWLGLGLGGTNATWEATPPVPAPPSPPSLPSSTTTGKPT